jgi:hypothetical protein
MQLSFAFSALLATAASASNSMRFFFLGFVRNYRDDGDERKLIYKREARLYEKPPRR